MRITFVLPHAGLSGGIRVVAIYADHLSRRGHRVVVVSTPRRLPPVRGRIRSLLKGDGWPTYRNQERSPYFEGSAAEHRIIEAHRSITDADVPDADVVVATWWETAEWVWRLSPSKGAKAHFIQHYETWGGPADRVDRVWRLPMHRITISQWLIDLARDRFADHDASLVLNSVDTRQFNAPPRGKQPAPTVGMLYSTSSFKGVNLSLDAWHRCAQRMPGLRLVSFGGEEPIPDLPLPPEAQFTCRPAQASIKDIYAACDVWLCGSRSEGFHLPPLEAMACRCPVVATRVGGPMDIIDEGVNGHRVDVGDADALADRLVRVLSLPEPQWRAMSDAAYATATRYTWDDATDLFEQALHTAIERNCRGELTPKRLMGVVA